MRASGLLNSLGYHNVLARGFTLTRDAEGRMLRRAADVHRGERLDIEFADGHVPAQADGGDRKATTSPKRARSARRKAGHIAVSGLATAARRRYGDRTKFDMRRVTRP